MNPILKDQCNILSTLSIRRVWNSWLLLIGYFLSKWFKKPIQLGYPSSISFEPTTSCNLRCPECPSGLRAFTRPTGMLENKLFEKAIVEMSAHLYYLIFYFQGEPYFES